MDGVNADRRTRFEAVVDEVGVPLRRYLLRRTEPDAAEDVLADTFLVIWRRLDDIPEGQVLPWCYSVARNCLANQRRSRRRRAGLHARVVSLSPPAPAELAPTLPDPELHEALAALRPQDRELIRLWAWEDLPPAEIAVVLGVSANAVHIRLHRVRKRLARLLADSEVGKVYGSCGHRRVEEGRTP